jgi:DNA-binding phage protein
MVRARFSDGGYVKGANPGVVMNKEQFDRLLTAIERATDPDAPVQRSMSSISMDAGFGRNYVSQLIKLRRMPKLGTLEKLCQVLGVAPAWVLFGEEFTPEDEDTIRRIQALPRSKRALLKAVVEALDSD